MGAVYTLNGNSAGAVAAVGSVTKETEKTDRAFKEAAKSAERLEQKLQAQAAKIKESIDPQTKLNRLYKELGEHVKAGRLSIDEAAQAGARYRRELGLAADAGKRVAQSTDQAFGAVALAKLTSYLTGLATVSGAIALIRSEIQANIDVGQRISRSQLSAAEAEASLRETVASDPNRERIISEAKRIAAARNLPLASIFTAMDEAYAAGGNADLAIRTVDTASTQSRNQQRMIATASGIGDIVNTTGIKNVDEAAGYLALVKQTSRVDAEKVAGGIGKLAAAVTSPTAMGSEATAAAIFSALTVGGADPQGDRMRTAGIQMIDQTNKFFLNKKGKNLKKYGLGEADVDTFDERMAILMAAENSGMAKDFVASSQFETPARGAVSRMFLSDDMRALYRDARDKNDEAGERVFAAADRASFILQGNLQGAAMTEQVIDTGIESLDVNSMGVLSSAAREKLIQLGGQTSGNFQAARLAMWQTAGYDTSRDEAISYLTQQRDQLEANFRERDSLGADPAINQAQQPMLEKMDKMISELQIISKRSGGKAVTRAE
jgi:hypothetical protein